MVLCFTARNANAQAKAYSIKPDYTSEYNLKKTMSKKIGAKESLEINQIIIMKNDDIGKIEKSIN